MEFDISDYLFCQITDLSHERPMLHYRINNGSIDAIYELEKIEKQIKDWYNTYKEMENE